MRSCLIGSEIQTVIVRSGSDNRVQVPQTGDSFVKDCKLQKADLQRLFAYPANKREN